MLLKRLESAKPNSRTITTPIAWALVAIGVAGLLGGAWLYFRQPREPKSVSVNSGAAPSSAKPTPKAIDSYTVAPSLPKYLNIPVIGITKTRVIQLGLMKNNQIATPDNIYDTGWYNGSARPGQNGAMFIYGQRIQLDG